MVKRLKFIVLLLVMFNSYIYAQKKLEKYCEVQFTQKSFAIGDKINIYFSEGSVDSLFSFNDTTIKANLKKVKTFKTKIDVLNYMAAIKWSVVFFNQNYFIFKRDFEKTELSAK